MKKYVLILAMLGMLTKVMAQSIKEIKPVFDVCIAIHDAVAVGNNETLRNLNERYKQCEISHFNSLRLIKGEEISLNGHFVFDPVFIDSLVVNRQTYVFAQRYADVARTRGATDRGKIFVKTCVIQPNASFTYSFPARGYQEIAVVTEPQGAISLKVHDTTNGKWYRDTKAVNEGKPYRALAFELPSNTLNTLNVEITNTADREISFVIISN